MPATETTTTTTTVLGKRKMRTKPSKPEKEEEEEEPAISAEEAQAILRRHFEAKFKPLSPSHAPTKPDASTVEDLRSDSDDDDDDASEASWSGVSGAEDSEAGMDSDSEEEEIEVVSYANNTTTTSNLNGLSKREAKAYLSSRVPSALISSSSTTTTTTTQNQNQKSSSTGNGGADEDDAPTLLKNDLALQRLLTESHLFSNSKSNSNSNNNNNNNTTTTTTTEHAGRNRHLATDLRLGALGSKRSIYAQQKMPMSVRKGIAGAATDRETRRRREARESGVVLERKSGTGATAAWLRGFGGGAGGKDRRRSGGGGGGGGQKGAVDAPAVGKLRNGMLTLSKRDVSEIQGGGGGSGSGGGRGGKGGKRRRR